ncbi:MAG: hypothetical protein HY720_17240 [Planctomycetes bacterium]|nr:hypothetical protein [Planctomycetota bacterium]
METREEQPVEVERIRRIVEIGPTREILWLFERWTAPRVGRMIESDYWAEIATHARNRSGRQDPHSA